MNPFRHFRAAIIGALDALAAEGGIPAGLDTARVAVEPPRDAAHGDLATNAAMVLAKPAGMKPRDLAEKLAARLADHEDIAAIEIAGPGFVNLRIVPSFWQARLADVFAAGEDYGAADIGEGRAVNVEYVSANPTGPLHVGHGRGAVFGDVLASLLQKVGYAVTREYYINDSGGQVEALARSLYVRYGEALGDEFDAMPEGLYPGEYLKDVAEALVARDGDKWRDLGEGEWLEPLRAFAVDELMKTVREDLDALGIQMDVYTSERALTEAGAVDEAFADLEAKGLIYRGQLDPPKGKRPDDWEPREQTLFRASELGDDTDRPLKKSDGSWTYFAADIAYHRDKFHRGFADMIDVWGADHGGYVKRMGAAVTALSDGKGTLDIKLCQLVNLTDRGKVVRMSKRAGTFVTLREVVDRVGRDVVRFIMLTRRNDAALDFDLAKVTEQSRDNPVFYVQYAHARARSVFRNAAEALPDLDLTPAGLAAADAGALTDPAELALIRRMAFWPQVVEGAARAHEPHRLAFYMYDLAAEFHALWTLGKDRSELRFIVEGEPGLTQARLALVGAVATVIAAGLRIFGVEPVEEMR